MIEKALFYDRSDAGKRLAQALKIYDNAHDTLVIALPRGGVVVGYEIAAALHLPLDVICPRKVGAPFNRELAIGAVTETGESVWNQELIKELQISSTFLNQAAKRATQEAQTRIQQYRCNKPPPEIAKKRIILVDDGIATGATMWAALKTLKAEKASEIILAIPVGPASTIEAFKNKASQIVVLSTPSPFFAVGQFYKHFGQIEDAEVMALLKQRKVFDHS